MAKKKTSRVSPALPKMAPKFVDYDTLTNGDAFIHEGQLCMKCENEEQEAINLDTGTMFSDMCNRIVEPVNITVAWKKK